MPTKSHVSLAQHQCPVCLTVFDTNELLLDRRMRNTLEPRTLTGHSLCPDCSRLNAEGYVALVVVSNSGVEGKLTQKNAVRTGDIAHVRRTVAEKIFASSVPTDANFLFCDLAVLEQLKAWAQQPDLALQLTQELPPA